MKLKNLVIAYYYINIVEKTMEVSPCAHTAWAAFPHKVYIVYNFVQKEFTGCPVMGGRRMVVNFFGGAQQGVFPP